MFTKKLKQKEKNDIENDFNLEKMILINLVIKNYQWVKMEVMKTGSNLEERKEHLVVEDDPDKDDLLLE